MALNNSTSQSSSALMGANRAQPGGGLLSVVEGAGWLGLKVPTIRKWMRERRLPYVKLGRRTLLRRVDLDALIDSALVPARLEKK